MGKLLIADDEEDLRDILSEMITDEGIEVVTVSDGVEALDKIIADHNSDRQIYAILSDINMPRMNGLELLRSVNEHEIEIPFIILTGYGDREKIMTALRFGAYDFQDKPFNRDRLLSSVQGAFKYGEELKKLEAEVEKIMSGIIASTDEQSKEYRTKVQKMLKLKFDRKACFTS